jgi:hypothetical protein
MARPAFSIFAQQYLSALLHDFGTVYLNEPMPREARLRVFKFPARSSFSTDCLKSVTDQNPQVMVNPEVIGEAGLVDVLFEPDVELSRTSLGLLGELLFVPSIIEPLRWAPDDWTMQSCLQHWLLWKIADHGSIIPVDETPVYEEKQDDDYDNDRDDDRDDDRDGDEEIDKILLIIVPSIDRKIIDGFGLNSSSRDIPGLYEFPPAFHTTVVVTSELPVDPSTLWLRLLGRGPTQRGAIAELMALDDRHSHRRTIVQQLVQWYRLLDDGNMGRESRALMQSLAMVCEG